MFEYYELPKGTQLSDIVTITAQKLVDLADSVRNKLDETDPYLLSVIPDKLRIIKSITSSIPAGTYNSAGVMLKSWDQLLADGDVTINSNGEINTPTDRNSRFMSAPAASQIVIPYGVKSIGKEAFYFKYGSLTNVVLPYGLKSIGVEAFRANSIQDITLPDSITSLGNSAFMDCSKLTKITLPRSLTTLGSWTFRGCTKLSNVYIPNTITTIYGNSVFMSCTALKEIAIPDSVTTISSYAFAGCDSLRTIYYAGTATGAPWGATNARVVA